MHNQEQKENVTVEAILGRKGAGAIWQERLGFCLTWAYLQSAAHGHCNKGKDGDGGLSISSTLIPLFEYLHEALSSASNGPL